MPFHLRASTALTPEQWRIRGDAIRARLQGLSIDELMRGGRNVGSSDLSVNGFVRHGYDPNQPRVPAGHRDGGQWTNTFQVGDRRNVRRYSRDTPNVVDDFGFDSPTGPQVWRAAASISIDDDALTRDPVIDKATIFLLQTLATTVELTDRLPAWNAARYGVAIHVAFGALVRNAGYEGIGPRDVEHSFSFGMPGRYGGFGTIRTDVLLRNIHGEVIAIYDVKTGGAKLDDARVRELRRKSGVGANVPIFELHVLRGASRRVSPDIFGGVIIRRWKD
jgi:hypothetical protein